MFTRLCGQRDGPDGCAGRMCSMRSKQPIREWRQAEARMAEADPSIEAPGY
jgi:hypothetical protein